MLVKLTTFAQGGGAMYIPDRQLQFAILNLLGALAEKLTGQTVAVDVKGGDKLEPVTIRVAGERVRWFTPLPPESEPKAAPEAAAGVAT
jgi:hypothetical protein